MLLFFSPVLTQRHGARSCQHISYTPLTPNYAHYNMYDVYRVNNSNVMTNPHSPLYYIRPLQTWKNIASPHYRLLSVVRFEIHVDKMSKKNWIVDIKPRNDGIWHTMVPFKWYVSDIKFFASMPWTLSRLFFHLREHNAIAQLPFRRHSSWTIRLQRRSKYDKEHTYGVYNCEQYKWYTIIEFEHDIESNDIVSRNLPFTWKYLGYTFQAKGTRDTKDWFKLPKMSRNFRTSPYF